MKYLITGRDIRVTPVEESTDTPNRRNAAARRRDKDGRFASAATSGTTSKGWTKLFVLAKEVGSKR